VRRTTCASGQGTETCGQAATLLLGAALLCEIDEIRHVLGLRESPCRSFRLVHLLQLGNALHNVVERHSVKYSLGELIVQLRGG
jgi:hypothetical protein